MTGSLAFAVGSLPAPETDLGGFAWLVGFVLAGFLLLARLSQGAVDGESEDADGDGAGRLDRPGSPTGGPTEAGGSGTTRTDDAAADDDSPVSRPLAPDGATPRAPTAAERPELSRPERQVRSVGAPAEDPALTPGLLLLNVALTQGLFGALLAGGAWYFGVPLPALGVDGSGLSTGVPALAVGVGFGVVLWVGNELASGLAAASGADYDEGLRGLLAPAGRRGWLLLLGATLPTIAVVEEFIFRAAVVGATTAAVGASPWLLAVVSSVAFALGHGAQGRVGVVVTGGLGLALAAGFVLTNSLLAVVVAHYLVNALEFLVHEGLGLPDPVWA